MQDLRYAIRSLRKQPGFTLVAVLTLALGLSAVTTIYALLERVVLDPLPYEGADRMVQLTSAVPGAGPDEEWNLSAAQYLFLSQQATTLEAAGAYQIWSNNVQGLEGPVRATVAQVTVSALRLIGATTSLGRMFTEEDDRPGAPSVVLLSDAFWRREFGADSGVVGRALMVNEFPREIIGVLGPDVQLPTGASQVSDPEINVDKPDLGAQPGLWVPMGLDPAGPFYNDHGIPVIARLREQVTFERAQAEMDALTSRLPEAFPRVYSASFMGRTRFRTRLHPLKAYVVGGLARSLWILFGGVGLVLAIAAANVANLVLVRAEGRHREVAIRAALGAGRLALVRQLFAETLVLAGAGGALALVVGSWSLQWLTWVGPAGIPRLGNLKLDGDVYLFTLAVTIAVALGLAVFVAREHRAAGAMAAGMEGSRAVTAGRERQRMRGGLVVLQMALALVLVVSSGLLIESLRRLRATDPGIDPTGVLTMRISLPPTRYSELPAQWRFYDAVRDRIEALPGVASAGVSLSLPFTGTYGCTVHGFEDAAVLDRMKAAGSITCGALTPTSPGYFAALGIPLVAGRTFTDADNDQPGTGAVIVSRAFADRFWPGEDPIGKGVRPFNSGTAYYRVVGEVGDVPAAGLDGPPALAIYYPIVAMPGQPRWWPSTMFLVVRVSRGDPSSLLAAIRRSVAEVDASIPLANAEEMQTAVDRSMARLSFTTLLLGVAATVALALAALGLYGVISYVVALRTKEIGVRVALGARQTDVQRLVVLGSLGLAALGVGAGTLGALALTRVLRGLLHGVEPTHPAMYLAATGILGVLALLAAYLPARRAARIDPMEALRYE